MKKICPQCNTPNKEEFSYCMTCGQTLENAVMVEDIDETPPINHDYMPPVNMVQNGMPGYYKPKEYKWSDVFVIIGFVASILGLFRFSVLLLPLGLILSFLGFRSNKTKGLAVGGMAISVVSICLKIGSIIYEYGDLPNWLTSGLFW